MTFITTAASETPTGTAEPVRQRLTSYRMRVALPLAVVLIYPLIAFYAPTNGRAEFYPFFTWNLFAGSTSDKADAVLLVHRIGGVALDEPTPFFELKDTFAAARQQNIHLAKLLDNYVLAVIRSNTEMQAALDDVIQNTFLIEASDVHYDISVIYYHPIERYTDGNIADVWTVASKQKGAS